ncbi:MAG TPA: ribonuclease domain-containing protein [Nocardioides sp.]|nr:ribonuclease domain-containing protein [Nocardioides sp.]
MARRGRPAGRVASAVLTVALLLGAWWLQSQGQPQGEDRPGGRAEDRSSAPAARDEDGIAYVDLADLPPEAAETVALVDAGGPFPYPGKDGSTFGNFEGVLPDRERGYYAEYTVETPGLDHRGARRIIAGDGGELYWTEDHYVSFERIRR